MSQLHTNGDVQEHGGASLIAPMRRCLLAAAILLLTPFALPGKLLIRKSLGRRAFSLLGLLTSYVLFMLICFFASLVGDFLGHGAVISVGGAAEAAGRVSPAHSWRMLVLFMRGVLVLGLAHKLAMRWRRAQGGEPVTTSTGVSRLDPLWRCLRPCARWFFSYDSMVKTLLDPLALWLLAKYVAAVFFDPTVAAVLQWSAIAMGLESYLSFALIHAITDDAGDQMEVWKQRTEHLRRQRLEGGRAAQDEVHVARVGGA